MPKRLKVVKLKLDTARQRDRGTMDGKARRKIKEMYDEERESKF